MSNESFCHFIRFNSIFFIGIRFSSWKSANAGCKFFLKVKYSDSTSTYLSFCKALNYKVEKKLSFWMTRRSPSY